MKLDKKVTTALIVIAFLAAGTAFASIYLTAGADENAKGNSKPAVFLNLSDRPVVPTSEAIADAAEKELAIAIAHALGIEVTPQEIISTKSKYLGNGEIALAYHLAQSSGKPAGEIIEMRTKYKMGWCNIAKTLGVKLKPSTQKVKTILYDARLDNDANEFMNIIKFDIDKQDTHSNNDDNAVSRSPR